jgi:hypothetical protein
MNTPVNERALTEVVGFVLILAVITAAFSLYLTYAVPAQGRENEIRHMNDVKDQFSLYKFTLDALWTNQQVGNSATSTFELGTAGLYTQGGNKIIPAMNPVSSTATFTINNRNETLSVSSLSLITDPRNTTATATAIPLSPGWTGQWVRDPPSHLLVNISGTGSLQNGCGILVNGSAVNGVNWTVYVNKTPRYTYYPVVTWTDYPKWGVNLTANMQVTPGYKYNKTDITVSVFKNGVPTIQDFVVYSNITSLSSPGANYSVDLMDDVYGLKTITTYPAIFNFTRAGVNNDLTAWGVTVYSFTEQQSAHDVNPGAIQYTTNNLYWIQQVYYYQMGGVFLEQTDGASYKLAPSLTFGWNGTTSSVNVKIIEIVLDPSSTGIIGGSTPIQLRTRLKEMTTLPYAPVLTNSKWVTIKIRSDDPLLPSLWYSVFDEAANKSGGIPLTWYTVGKNATHGWITMNGPDAANSTYDIRLEVTRVNFLAKFHGLGGVLE